MEDLNFQEVSSSTITLVDVSQKKAPPKKRKSPPPGLVTPHVLPPCRVCGEKATGIHYGVNTCGGCKGFFSRSLTRSSPYECLRSENCNVGKLTKRRKSCPKCRLDKCLDMGMSKDAIRQGRYTYSKRNDDIEEVRHLEKQDLGQTQKFQFEQLELSDSETPVETKHKHEFLKIYSRKMQELGLCDFNQVDLSLAKRKEKNITKTRKNSRKISVIKSLLSGDGSQSDDVTSEDDNTDLLEESYNKQTNEALQSNKDKTQNTNHLNVSSNKDIDCYSHEANFESFSLDLQNKNYLNNIVCCDINNACTIPNSDNIYDFLESDHLQFRKNQSSFEDINFLDAYWSDTSSPYSSSCLSQSVKDIAYSSNSTLETQFNKSVNDISCCTTNTSETALNQSMMDNLYSTTSNSETPHNRSVNHTLHCTTTSSGIPLEQPLNNTLHCTTTASGIPQEQSVMDIPYCTNITSESSLKQSGESNHSNIFNNDSTKVNTNVLYNSNSVVSTKEIADFLDPINEEASFQDIVNDLSFSLEPEVENPNSCDFDGNKTSNENQFELEQIIDSYGFDFQTSLAKNISENSLNKVDNNHNMHLDEEKNSFPQSLFDSINEEKEVTDTKIIVANGRFMKNVQKILDIIMSFDSSALNFGPGKKLIQPILSAKHELYPLKFTGACSTWICMTTASVDSIHFVTSGYSSPLAMMLSIEDGVQPSENIQSRFEDSHLDSLVHLLSRAHCKTIGYDCNTMDQTEIQHQYNLCLENCALNCQKFGSATILGVKEYFDIYDQTGIDIDGRKALHASMAICSEESIRKVVRFAKAIPGFCSLPLQDRMVLIKGGIHDHFILGSFRGSDESCRALVDLEINHLYCIHDYTKVFSEAFVEETRIAMNALRALNLTPLQAIILKAISMTAPQGKELIRLGAVKRINSKLIQCLQMLISRDYTSPHDQMFRIHQSLQVLRQFSTMAFGFFRMYKTEIIKRFGLDLDQRLSYEILVDHPFKSCYVS